MTDAQKANGIIALPVDFVSLDVETTGHDTTYNHIIEISAARYRDGQLTDTYSSLIRPPQPVPEYITALTGINNEMLSDAPELQAVLPDFSAFLGDDILIGHNIGFDINFLNHAGYEIAQKYINTLRLSRKINPDLEHHRLQDLAAHYGIQPETFHRSLADSISTARVYLCMRRQVLDIMTEAEFVSSFRPSYASVGPNYREFIASMDPVDAVDSAISGKTVVFTGALDRMERKDALLLVAQLGGIPADGITKKTNILVVGNGDFASSVKNGKTGKMKKAEEYAAKGFDIITVSEDTFFELIS